MQKTQPVKKAEKTDSIVLNLVVGHLGSLDNDPGEPVYDLPDESSEKIGTLQYNCCVLKADGNQPSGWVHLDLGRYGEGYVKEKNVIQKTITIEDADKVRMGIIKDALSYLSLDFVRYGTSLESGIDCSNFVQQIYGLNGITTPSKCNDIIKDKKVVNEDQVRVGDIVYYPVNNGYGHVGMYLSDGFLINSTGHAGKTYPDGGVRICNLKYRDREEYTLYDVIDN